jgi:hypothetical protein
LWQSQMHDSLTFCTGNFILRAVKALGDWLDGDRKGEMAGWEVSMSIFASRC